MVIEACDISYLEIWMKKEDHKCITILGNLLRPC